MFANRLRFLRLTKGLNQVQLAQKLGVKKQSVSNWENDNIMPSIEMLIKIADYFNVSTDYLLGRDRQDDYSTFTLDVTGLSPLQREHLRLIVDDLRNKEH